MGSGSWTSINPNELGMIPRAFSDMFAHTEAARAAGVEVVIRVSFIEIHNEELRDLLDSGYKSNQLAIREDAEGGIFVAGAEEKEVTCLDEILGHLERGTGCRSTASTHMNEHSSRSHAIFTVQVEQRKEAVAPSAQPASISGKVVTEETPLPPPPASGAAPPTAISFVTDSGVSDYVTSKFHFVDLAGSERVKRTRAEGDRLKEGIHINCGLLSLGNVISALGDDKKRAAVTHVPYRDSKLTRLLQDSLGGNASNASARRHRLCIPFNVFLAQERS
jgi:kinesin family protein 4/21/27